MLLLSASLILLTNCLEVDAVVLIGAGNVAEVVVLVLKFRFVACMARSRPVIPLDESELERVTLSA